MCMSDAHSGRTGDVIAASSRPDYWAVPDAQKTFSAMYFIGNGDQMHQGKSCPGPPAH